MLKRTLFLGIAASVGWAGVSAADPVRRPPVATPITTECAIYVSNLTNGGAALQPATPRGVRGDYTLNARIESLTGETTLTLNGDVGQSAWRRKPVSSLYIPADVAYVALLTLRDASGQVLCNKRLRGDTFEDISRHRRALVDNDYDY